MPSSMRPGNVRVLGLLLVGCVLAIALAAAGLGSGFGLAGWINAKPKGGEKPGGGSALLPEGPAPPSPLFADWPEGVKPSVVLAITGEMDGYLRPCGCSLGQVGGLPRRGGALQHLRKKLGWEVVPIDMGDLVSGPGELEQLRYKTATEALKKLGYRCIGVGMNDLRALLLQNLLGQIGQEDAAKGVKYLMGGVTLAEKDFADILKEMAKPVQLIEQNGRKIAVAWLMDDAEKMQEVKGNPIAAAVPALLKEVEALKPDVKVLLAHVPSAKAESIAEKFPGFDVIVSRSDSDDSATSFAKRIGKSLVIWVGKKGKSMGVVGLFPDDPLRLRYSVVLVEDREEFPNDPEQDKLYTDFVAEVKRGNFVEKTSRLPTPDKDAFVGAQTCGKCHKKAFEKWSTTRHAHAFESLAESHAPGKQFVPAGQQYNPECVKCHTTGFNYQGGFVSPEKTPQFFGNQCENCHGPGKKHSDDPTNALFREQVRRLQSVVETTVCRKCHDLDNSPKFDFAKAWPQIAHPWRD